MSKHLLDKQIYDSIFNEDEYPLAWGDEPCVDPDCVEDNKIYDMINDEEFNEDVNMDELELDDYNDYMIV
jgi:hypothetical protein